MRRWEEHSRKRGVKRSSNKQRVEGGRESVLLECRGREWKGLRVGDRETGHGRLTL